ncbi:hypothetical protein ACFQX6_48295 [Streptosporangium lutulentum]
MASGNRAICAADTETGATGSGEADGGPASGGPTSVPQAAARVTTASTVPHTSAHVDRAVKRPDLSHRKRPGNENLQKNQQMQQFAIFDIRRSKGIAAPRTYAAVDTPRGATILSSGEPSTYSTAEHRE